MVGLVGLVGGLLLAPAQTASASVPRSPLGHVDSLAYNAPADDLLLGGWAGDVDAGPAGIRVHVYLDGKIAVSAATGLLRNDVAKVLPALGPRTGFLATVHAPPGRGVHQLCAYGINQGPGQNVLLGCKLIVRVSPGALIGHIDSITVDPKDPTKRIATGWALDPFDALSPTELGLLGVSGPYASTGRLFVANIMAGLPRPDVDRAYPRNGTKHGFQVTFDANGPATLPTSRPVAWLPGATVCIALHQFVPGGFTPTPYCAVYPG